MLLPTRQAATSLLPAGYHLHWFVENHEPVRRSLSRITCLAAAAFSLASFSIVLLPLALHAGYMAQDKSTGAVR